MHGLLWLLLFTLTVSAQTTGDDELVSRLNSALLPLKSLPKGDALPDLVAMTAEDRAALRAAVANQNPAQNRVMLRFADDMAELYGVAVILWDFAYALTSVLAGKDVSQDTLTPLTSSILGALDSAFARSNLRKSAQFRASVEHAYDALLALGVSPANTRVVVDSLLKAADLIVNRRPFQLIPPAFPPMLPQRRG